MADLKISALPASTVPLAGTEVLPIVQSSATKQVTVANLTAGRAVATGALTVTGDATLSTGNLVIGTSGNGIDFTAAGGNVLNQYDEYTAPSAACTGAITTAVIWKATKVGNVVTLTLPTTTGIASTATNFQYGELLPAAFRPSATIGFISCPIKDADANLAVPGMIFILTSGVIRVYKDATGATNFTLGATAGIGQSIGTSVSWTI